VSDARRTTRNAGWLILQRGVHVVTATLFALLVPRLMGPVGFGKYALLTSVAMWFGRATRLSMSSAAQRGSAFARRKGRSIDSLRRLVRR